MNDPFAETIEKCSELSLAGTISFGEVVARLAAVGVEAYFADYRGKMTTYFAADGRAFAKALASPAVAIPDAFDKEGIQSAIRGAQQGEVMYPEFMARSMAAGCVGYMVWIAGRHVTYFGRRGEQHVEHFPG